MVVSAQSGVESFGLMKTLMSLFPLVAQVCSNRSVSDELLAEPYADWHLLAFDSYLNIIISRYTEDIERTSDHDMAILVGSVAREWIKLNRY